MARKDQCRKGDRIRKHDDRAETSSNAIFENFSELQGHFVWISHLKKEFQALSRNSPRGELAIPFSEINTSIETKIEPWYQQTARPRKHVVTWLTSFQTFCGRVPFRKAACCQHPTRENEISEQTELPWDGNFMMDNPPPISNMGGLFLSKQTTASR